MYKISNGGLVCNTLDTIESIMLTKNKLNIDGVKLDVRKSFDNIFVIAKDEELDKFTYGKGKVSEYNYNYLRKIKFPSHIFKYYIPKLEEILKKYDNKKIIVLELYSVFNLDQLFILLIKYNYKYYFLSKDNNLLNKLRELDYDKIGKIIDYSDILFQDNDYFFIKN